MSLTHAFSSSEVHASLQALSSAVRFYEGPCVSFRFSDGTIWTTSPAPAQFVITFRSEKAWKQFLSTESTVSPAELFITGDLDIDGNPCEALYFYEQIRALVGRATMPLRVKHERSMMRFVHWVLVRFQRGVEREQALPSCMSVGWSYEFYRKLLGPSLVFTAGHFETFDEDLEYAQIAGLHRICQQLQLSSHDRFLDLGCNWGSLLLHVAESYGTSAHGLSQNNEQQIMTETRILESDLADRCSVRNGGYKELKQIKLPFTKIADVGFSEFLVQERLLDYFRAVSSKLRPDGLLLIDVAVRTSPSSFEFRFVPRIERIHRMLPGLSNVLAAAEEARLIVVNVEEIQAHYERTFRLWLRSLANDDDELFEASSRDTVRAWRLGISSVIASLRAGHTTFHRLLFRKQNTPRLECGD